MGEDVLCANTPGKVVAFPIRPYREVCPFHHPVVIGDPGIVKTRPPNTNPRCIQEITDNINIQLCPLTPYLSMAERADRGTAVVKTPLPETSQYESTAHRSSSLSATAPVVPVARSLLGHQTDVIGICPFNLRPSVIAIPFVVSEVNVEDCPLWVDRTVGW